MVSGLALEIGEDDAFNGEGLDGDEEGEDGDDGEVGFGYDDAALVPEFAPEGHQAEDEQETDAIGDDGRGVYERTDANRFFSFRLGGLRLPGSADPRP